MFLKTFRYNNTKTGKYVKELPLSFPKLKTEFKTPYGSIFIAVFGLADGRKITHIFWSKLQISQPVLNIMS